MSRVHPELREASIVKRRSSMKEHFFRRGLGATLHASRFTPHERSRVSDERGVTLILLVFGLIVLSSLALAMVNILVTTTATSRSHFRVTQAFFIGDVGLSRAKEILDDTPTWRPSAANCAAYGMTYGLDAGTPYCRQTMTVGGTVSGHFDILVDDLGGGNIDVRIKSTMDVSED